MSYKQPTAYRLSPKNMLKKLFLILLILSKLGYRNVAYMAWYRLSIKLGWRKRKFPLGTAITGTFFKAIAPMDNYPESWKSKTLEKSNRILEGKLTWFHYHSFQVGNPPNWFLNPFDGSVLNNPQKHWTALSDFELNTGDVKILWEPSRFDWLSDLARGYRITGEEKYLQTINQWLQDWSQHNPKNQGPNWKCGQETAIRVMKLITTTQLLEQDTTATKALQQLVYEHLERIAGNINYAIAQDNNHGTSEATGLYIGATWLLNQKNKVITPSKLRQWKKRGRKLLENRILKLIAPQGTFAQKSVTYHRVVVDTMSWVLYAMERLNEPKFSNRITQRLQNLGEWQYKMIASPNGDAPNIGSNDGAMFETLHNCDYRDFKPSTQLFFGVLKKQRLFFAEGDYDEALFWRYPKQYSSFYLLHIKQTPIEILDKQFLIISHNTTKIYFVLPLDNFRPSSSDAFHLDLWHDGNNLLCDSGTYSYNAGEVTDKFKSITAHNSVQVNSQEPMPKISRFLYGKWLKANHIETLSTTSKIQFSASYSGFNNNKHFRKVEYDLHKNKLTVKDEIKKDENTVVNIFWNIPNESLVEVQPKHVDDLKKTINNLEVSNYYLEKHTVSQLSFSTEKNQIITNINF